LRVFVTGATGFIGSHLCKRLTEDGHLAVALVRDHAPSRWVSEALRGCMIVLGDVRSLPLLRRVITQYAVDWVFHLASQAMVALAARNPVETFESNVMGTVNVLEACRQLDVSKVHIQSTDKVYGNTLNATEESPLKVTEPYGTSKIAADLIAQTYRETYGMKVVIPRSCLFPRTHIVTEEGYKEICKVKVGEKVVTHRGRLRRVLKVYRRRYEGALYRFLVAGPHGRAYGVTLTSDHPILTDVGWLPAREVTQEMKVGVLARNLCKECKKPVPVWRHFCSRLCARNYEARDLKITEARQNRIRQLNKSEEWVRNRLRKTLKTQGQNSEEFYVDLIIQKHAPEFKFVGDGSFFIGTRCPDWVWEDRRKIIEYVAKPRRTGEIERKIEYYKAHGYEVLVLSGENFRKPSVLTELIRNFRCNHNGEIPIVYVPLSRIKKIETIGDYKGLVYNLEVEEDNSYVARELCVHNCNVFGLDYSWRIIPNTVRSCIRGEMPVIYVDESARQYIYVDDEVRTLIHLMKGPPDGVFNIPGHFKTQEEVVLEVLRHFPTLKPRYVTREAPKEIVRQSMKSDKLFSTLGVSFEEGVRLTIQRFREYREDWDR